MKRITLFSLIAAFAVLLSACGGSALRSSEGGVAPAQPMPTYYAPLPEAPAQDMGFVEEVPAVEPSGGGSGNVEPVSVKRLIIQNADVAIVVADVEARMEEIQAMAEQMGGYVVSSNLYQNSTRNNVLVPEATISIRVPAERLDEALEAIKKDAVEVQSETRSGQDVTAEYVDLQSRLKNLEAAEAQLNEILETATETEDVVTIFNQLVYYREQIELVKGQMKYYEEAAALSAISVRIIAEETIQPLEIGGWQPQGVARDAIQDLIYFYQDFVDFLIRFVIYTLPVWITIGVPLYLIFLGGRALFRKLRGGRKKAEEKKEGK